MLCKMDVVVVVDISGHLLCDSHSGCEGQAIGFVICHDDKEVTLEFTWNFMVGGHKLILVLIDQITNKQMVVVVQMDQLHRTYGKTLAHLFISNAQNKMGTKRTLEWYLHLVAPLGRCPGDPSVGEGPGCWTRLPPTKTTNHKGKAMSYA